MHIATLLNMDFGKIGCLMKINMDKQVYKSVMERASGKCEVCNKVDRLELHHILRRRVKETQSNCIALCPECHRGTDGVHGKNGHKLDLKLKVQVQEDYFRLGYTEEEVRTLMGGKLYVLD